MTKPDAKPPYFPQVIFGADVARPPRAWVSPHRYVQGPGELDNLGRYLGVLDVTRVGVLISDGGRSRFGERIVSGLKKDGISAVLTPFGGECSFEQIDETIANLGASGDAVDCLIAVGGGKCIDAGKATAWRMGIRVVVVPTLASTDAPCSALSVIYSTNGVQVSAEFFPDNPSLVLMDTEIVIAAPKRYLVSGMADALATWYEARVCLANPAARSTLGARPTLAATAIGQLCADTVYGSARGALEAFEAGIPNLDFENIVEANTLHSGLGFESGGLAGAHALASGLTIVAKVDEAVMHGEMVAMGILTQLVLEGDEAEYERALALFLEVGLPVHLGHVELDASGDAEDIKQIVAYACAYPTMANFEFSVDEAQFSAALLTADQRGREACEARGDAAFRALR
jgi:glycerol dehydrogenase